MFTPSGHQGRRLADALKSRLAASYEHLREACTGHVVIDQAATAARIREIRSAHRVRPELFVLHRHLVGAAHGYDITAASELFAELCRTPVAAPARMTIRNWADQSFTDSELARYRWAFCEEGDTKIEFAPVAEPEFQRARQLLLDAIGVLSVADADLHDEIFALVTEIVLAQSAVGQALTFDGVTAFYASGSIVLNAAEQRSVPTALATLVHEAAHCKLFGESEGAALVQNRPEERYKSPLRPDPRPMNGLFHAAFVSARMVYAFDQVVRSRALDGEHLAEIRSLRTGAREAFVAAHGVFQAHGDPTALGARLMAAAASHMEASLPAG